MTDRIMRAAEVVQVTGLHRATIHRKIAAGAFPQQVRLGANSVGWYEREVAAWLADPMGWGRAAA